MSHDQHRPMGGPTPIQRIAAEFHGLPLLGRWARGGATCAGVIGAVAGLVVGLIVHPPTAWFAVIELGLPSAIVGTALGTVGGLVVLGARRIRHRPWTNLPCRQPSIAEQPLTIAGDPPFTSCSAGANQNSATTSLS